MGTRGLNGFVLKEKTIAPYNHFDSYPKGLGKQTLKFILGVNNNKGWDKLKKNLAKVKLVNEDTPPTEKEIQLYKDSGFYDGTVGDTTSGKIEWYQLLRNTQAGEWMDNVYDGTQKHVIDNIDFIKESLFCEYAYLINLDTMLLEFYIGFQKKQQPSNRYGCNPNDDGYYPCRLMKTFNLELINDEPTIEEILKDMEKLCKEK